MKAVILAGGLGTRISEETTLKPKPMIEIGGYPIIWHIMKNYSKYGITEFIICCGYKGYVIKEYFNNYFLHMSDLTFDMKNNKIELHQNNIEPWKVTLIDTGEKSNTGGRLKRIEKYLEDKEDFYFTYGDGLSDVNFEDELKFHKRNRKLVTVTAVQPPGRYGALIKKGYHVEGFVEKPPGDGLWVNGGFFIVNKDALRYVSEDSTSWEDYSLKKIAYDNELIAYEHKGFWHSMDTLRDKMNLDKIWESGKAPWKNW
jgi:glucose-1-phosphate cytidylyltransferase